MKPESQVRIRFCLQGQEQKVNFRAWDGGKVDIGCSPPCPEKSALPSSTANRGTGNRNMHAPTFCVVLGSFFFLPFESNFLQALQNVSPEKCIYINFACFQKVVSLTLMDARVLVCAKVPYTDFKGIQWAQMIKMLSHLQPTLGLQQQHVVEEG